MQVEIVNPMGVVSYRRPHTHTKMLRAALMTIGYSLRFPNGGESHDWIGALGVSGEVLQYSSDGDTCTVSRVVNPSRVELDVAAAAIVSSDDWLDSDGLQDGPEYVKSDIRDAAELLAVHHIQSAPSWMHMPNAPGMWVVVAEGNQFRELVMQLTQDDLDRGAPFYAKASYGPIPLPPV